MKQKPKIIFLVRLYHPHVGGVEKHVEKTVGALRKKGYAITIVTEQFDKKLKLYEKHDDTEIFRIPIGGSAFYKKFSIWKWVLTHLSLFFKTDIIHIHDVFYWIIPIRFLLITKRIYITFHGYEGYPVKMRWKVLRKISEMLTNGNLCIGDFMKKWYSTSPTAISYGGVDKYTKRSTPQPQSAVFFGRFDSQTGVLEYVDAYKLIRKKYPKFRLTVIGSGHLKNKIPKSVKILPFDANIEPYISQNRFIFVSRYLSMLEALVQKREIVAVYDNPVKKDYLLLSPFKNYVFLAKNAKEIASTVEECIENSLYGKERVGKGYNWASKQTWEVVADAYLRLWMEK
ncbi:MAG: glycosyltransferase family 4 protein [Candidatus Levybacteria bacterium]|nr:glycosyltransferase family 4 protein [Candidatus Levybacteria bacterium]